MTLFGGLDRDDPERSARQQSYVPFRRPQALGRFASGSMRCPSCDVPVLLGSSISLTASMRCPYCRTLNEVRGYVRIDSYDTPFNAVELRARLPF